jgi:hypothetical protein
MPSGQAPVIGRTNWARDTSAWQDDRPAEPSFAAVRRTLLRRLLALTIHEGVLRDQELDVNGRERLFAEARALIHEQFGLPQDAIGRGEADRLSSAAARAGGQLKPPPAAKAA